MPTLLLHAGMSKAGSTAVQELMSANRRELGSHGIEYFPVLKGPNHTALAAAFCHRRARVFSSLGIASDRDRRRWQHELGKRLSRALNPESTWVASTEHLGTQLRTPAEVAECAEFLSRYFDRIVVVLVMRRADYWLPSAYQESVKAGSTHRFDLSYVRTRRNVLDHRALTDRWQAAFGLGRVASVPFLETDKKTLRTLPERILRAGGLAEESIVWDKPLSRLANPALSALATEVLRTANPVLRTSALRPTATRARMVSYIAEHWPGPALLLTRAALDALDELDLPLLGVAGSELVVGDEWSAWVDQPPAPLGSQLVLSPSERDATLRSLERAGLVRTHETRHGLPGRLAGKLMDPLRRARHR
jgi:hypothetical protein